MYSPDDIIFWFHHCNIDRLYHLWADCHQYEDILPANLTIYQYEAANPTSSDQWIAKNPYNRVPYDVGIDTKISFYWIDQDSDIFPSATWPTPRQLWGLGKPGAPAYDGIYYVYGPDQLAQTVLKTACSKNTRWTYVNYGASAKKRNIDPIMQEISDKFEEKLGRGKPHQEALYEMAVEECESTPRIVFNERSLAWIKMNNLHPTAFDRVCDKPSQQLTKGQDPHVQGVPEGKNLTSLWLVVVASIGSALILIFIVTVIIIFIRKRSASTLPKNDYRLM
jgi:hypothetical protein